MTLPFSWYVILALLITNLVTGMLWRSAKHEVDAIELSSQVAAERAELLKEEQEKITKDTTYAWKAALDVTRDDYAKRLRRTNLQQVPGVPNTPARVDEVPSNALPLAAQCAESTLMLLMLQDWEREQMKLRTGN